VPNLVANQDAIPYLPDYHAESDTLDKVNAREAQANAAIATALVWRLADDPNRFGRRFTHAEVEKMITDTKLDAQMKTFGQWDDWTAARRQQAVTLALMRVRLVSGRIAEAPGCAAAGLSPASRPH
jgi:carboxypeptidase Q